MQTTLQKKAKKVIDNLPEDKLKVVIDFMGYLQSRERIPNALTLATFRKSDAGKDLTRHKSVDTFFSEMGL